MLFGSVASGIEAASVAWHELGWKPAWLAEIDKFPSEVLAHRYPNVPNLGDMTALPGRILSGEIVAPDMLCGGTPCQAFSVAGNRNSLADERGNLTLKFVEIANAIDIVRKREGRPLATVFWENVPGVLSTSDNAFGCFLAALAGADNTCEPSPRPAAGKSGQHWRWNKAAGEHVAKWANAGVVVGPKRTIAWRTLDAQYFGLAQRRRRVFVVASPRDGADPAAILLEFDSLRRDTAPSREQGQEAAPTVTAGAPNGGAAHGARSGSATENLIVPVITRTEKQWPADVSCTLDTTFGSKMGLDDQHVNAGCPMFIPVVTHSLRGEGFDASEDDPGRGTPIVAQPLPFDTTQITSPGNYSNPKYGDPCHPLAAGAHPPAIAFPANLSGTQHAATENLSPSLGAKNPTAVAYDVVAIQDTRAINKAQNGRGWNDDGTAYTLDTHGTQGVAHPVLSFKPGQSEAAGGVFVTDEFAPTLQAQSNGSTATPAVLVAMQVRRLTPTECERLQGFPDGWTVIPRGKCPDGPRYKALGNSWPVNVVTWIGWRMVEVMGLPYCRQVPFPF